MVYVDYPGPASLTQIYGTFNRAMLRLIPSLRTYAEPLTAAMVEFYTMSQVTSTAPQAWAGLATLEQGFRVVLSATKYHLFWEEVVEGRICTSMVAHDVST